MKKEFENNKDKKSKINKEIENKNQTIDLLKTNIAECTDLN